MNANSVQQRQELFNTYSSRSLWQQLIEWLNNNNKEDVKLDEKHFILPK